MKVTALLRSLVGDFSCAVHDPGGKIHTFSFNKSNNFQMEVPTEMKYKTMSGKEVVFQPNFAQHLLSACKDTNRSSATFGLPVFELVQQVEHPLVVEAPKVEKAKAKKSEKEKTNENKI
jgi:hypothetical protein